MPIFSIFHLLLFHIDIIFFVVLIFLNEVDNDESCCGSNYQRHNGAQKRSVNVCIITPIKKCYWLQYILMKFYLG